MKPVPERALPVYTVDEPAGVGGGGCSCSSGGTREPRGIAETFASDRASADTATLGDTHGYGTFAGAPTDRCTDADIVTSDWDYGNGNLVATPASGNAGSGLTAMTGFRSQRLDYDGVFLMWKTGPRGGQVPGTG